jgi:hypothetical protein
MIGALMAAGIQVRIYLRTAATDRAARSYVDLTLLFIQIQGLGDDPVPRWKLIFYILASRQHSACCLCCILIVVRFLRTGSYHHRLGFRSLVLLSKLMFLDACITPIDCTDHLILISGRWVSRAFLRGATLPICTDLVIILSRRPSNAKWLKAEYRSLAVARVAKNGTGIKTTTFNVRQGLSALYDIKAWMLSLAMFGSSVPNGILTNFSGPIIKGLGFSTLNAALLDCAGRSLQVISLLIAGILA